MPKKEYEVHISTKITPPPEPHEISAAWLLARYFQSNVYFEPRTLIKSADLMVNEARWELKSPIGNGKHTIQNNIREATHQSANIVIDLRRSKIHQAKALSQIKHTVKNNRSTVQQVLVILKNEKVIDATP